MYLCIMKNKKCGIYLITNGEGIIIKPIGKLIKNPVRGVKSNTLIIGGGLS